MTKAVEIVGVSKSYGSVRALNGVDFDVQPGELFGLIGPDGAGKSSMYGILATLSRPDSGSAKIFGLDTVADRRKLRDIIGYMPEKFSLYQDMTVKENLEFFADLFGVKVGDNREIIASVFQQLERFPNRLAKALSGGMKQKLALSCALIHRPKILLLDEPTTGVDAVSRSEFWDMLQSLRHQGITIVVSTSYMDEATRCDRVAMIDHGNILAVDTPEALSASFSQPLYEASSADMYGLLTALRSLPEICDCYTFGASLHVVASPKFSVNGVMASLRGLGISDAVLKPTKANIEDLFIKFSENGK